MGIFGNSSPFDQDVERATSETNTSEDWGLILEICDRAGSTPQNAKDCLRAALRRLAHPDPHVQVQAATLLDACVSNCGRVFHLEIASRDFEAEFRRLLSRTQPAVAQRLRALLRKWAEGEFRSDPQLDLIPSLHAKLRAELGESGTTAPRPATPTATATASTVAQREQDELARAIELSLRESTAAPASAAALSSTLYPRVDTTTEPAAATQAASAAPARKVRALYDFEAAEDNELTFLAGEIVHVTDSSDPNWWKGYNERGEGLFPANFVTADLTEPVNKNEVRGGGATKTVQFEEPVVGPAEEPARIDEAALDEALALLLEADPARADDGAAEARLHRLEARAHAMGPLIDTSLERADRRHARLTQLSADLVAALNLYHELMREPHVSHAPHQQHPPHPPHPHHPHYAPPPPPPPPPRFFGAGV